jgi:hypothetical protein
MFMVHVKGVVHGEALPYVRQLVTGLLPWRLGFHSNLVLVGFAVYIMLLEKVFLGVLWFFLVIIIPAMLHMHSFICHWYCIISVMGSVFLRTCVHMHTGTHTHTHHIECCSVEWPPYLCHWNMNVLFMMLK